jgi:hypothetical protein
VNVNEVEDDVAEDLANTTVGAASACPPTFAKYGYPLLILESILQTPVPAVKSHEAAVNVDSVFISAVVLPVGPQFVEVAAPTVLSQKTPVQLEGNELLTEPTLPRLAAVE